MKTKIISTILVICISLTALTYRPQRADGSVTLGLAAFATIAKIAGVSFVTAYTANKIYEEFLQDNVGSVSEAFGNVIVDSNTGLAAFGAGVYSAAKLWLDIKYPSNSTYEEVIPVELGPITSLQAKSSTGQTVSPIEINAEGYHMFKPFDFTALGKYYLYTEHATTYDTESLYYGVELTQNGTDSRTFKILGHTSDWYFSASNPNEYIGLKTEYLGVINGRHTQKFMAKIYRSDGKTWEYTSTRTTTDLNLLVAPGYTGGETLSEQVIKTDGIAVDSPYWGNKTWESDHPDENLRDKRAIPPMPLDWLGDLSTGTTIPDTNVGEYDTTTTSDSAWDGTTTTPDDPWLEIPILGDILSILRAIAQTLANVFAIPDTLSIDTSPLKINLATFFPFSIPFDLYNAFTGLAVSRAAPVWTANILGETITIDMSEFDQLATIVRWGALILFNLGLILATRRLIKG